MEVPGGNNNTMFVLLSELIGTAFVMMAVNWGGVSDSAPQCVAMTVFILIQLFGNISGGHFNPAVTLAMLFKEGKANWMRNFTFSFIIIIAQGIGALLGTLISMGGFSFEPKNTAIIPSSGQYHPTQLCPSNGCNDGGELVLKVVITEATCTFLFVSMVLMVVKHNGSDQMPINALGIAISLYCAITLASGISGGCINPAVGLLQTLFQRSANAMVYSGPSTSVVYAPAYVGGTFLGGFIAGMYHKWIHEAAINKSHDCAEEAHGALMQEN